jgi:hypothetical protein
VTEMFHIAGTNEFVLLKEGRKILKLMPGPRYQRRLVMKPKSEGSRADKLQDDN